MFGSRFLRGFRGFRINRTIDDLEFQDVILDKMVAEGGMESSLYSDQKLEVPLARGLLLLLYGFGILLIMLLFGRTFYLQAFAGEELEKEAIENTVRSTPLESDRGVIYDQHGTQLVFNKPSFDFVCDKRDLPAGRLEKEQILRDIAGVLNVPFATLREELDRTKEPKFLLAENLEHETLVALEAREGEFPGCSIQKNTIRDYLRDSSLAHILGYTAKISPEELRQNPEYLIIEQIGKIGLERAYESTLRGVPGRSLIEKDARGNIVKEKGEVPSEPGDSLVLWLDADLQKKAAETLQATLDRIGAQKGVAIALDPNTGGVLALVSIPDFDNNLFSYGITQEQYNDILENRLNPLFNRAIAGSYPVGSTIKPIVAAAALEEDLINPTKKLETRGYIEIPHAYDPEISYRFDDWKNHGAVNMTDAIAVSSNVYFYTIGGGYEGQRGLGPTRIKEYLTRFGWGSTTGIDLPGERKGLIPDPEWKKEVIGENWWDGDTYNMSIGQGNVAATPLQVVASFAAIANGGTIYKPQMVKEVVETQTEFPSVVIKEEVIDPENMDIVREGMRQAVKWGSSVILNQMPVTSAAKTGTAQTGRKDEEGRDYLYSWVTAFAPYENPEIVLTVMVEDAKEGSFVVLPVAKEVLEWYFTR